MEYSKLATGLLILTFLKCTSSHAMVEELKKTFIPFWLKPEARSNNRSQALQDVKGKERAGPTPQSKQAVTVGEFLAENATAQPTAVSLAVRIEPISAQTSPQISQPKELSLEEFCHKQIAPITIALDTCKFPLEVQQLLEDYKKNARNELRQKIDVRIVDFLILSKAKSVDVKWKEVFKKTYPPDCMKLEFSIRTERNYENAHANLKLAKKMLKHRNSENGKSCYN